MFRSINLLLFLICFLFVYNGNQIANNQNDDILSLLIETPDQLEFVACRKVSEQIVLEAKYRVSGPNASLIEDLLHKRYGMSLLKYACCGWESYADGQIEITDKFNDKFEALYEYNDISISMNSEETLIQERSQWNEVPYFYVYVRVLNI